MISLLINGVYDLDTFEVLRARNIQDFAFDLRGRSSNLITFKDLQTILTKMTTQKVYLTFENDKKETVLSFLNLLGTKANAVTLIFRDHLDASFYQDLNRPFYWMFSPEGDWKKILSLDKCQGTLLPVRFQTHFHKLPELWNLFDEKNLDVFLHAETFEQTVFMNLGKEIKLSLDLSPEVEKSYRNIDHEKLLNMKIWRSFDEASSGQ